MKKLFFGKFSIHLRIIYFLEINIINIIFINSLFAQQTMVKGTIVDKFTKEKISFASIAWKNAGYGGVSDSAGNFSIVAKGFTTDTLIVTYIGLEKKLIPYNANIDTTWMTVLMETAKPTGEVIVKSKHSRGYYWWKKIVSHKPLNNPYQYKNYGYKLYNKLELDLENVDKKTFEKNKLLKNFSFILDNMDSTSEEKAFLPVFFTESLSNCYYSISPDRKREEMIALQTNGIQNESVLQFIGGTNQKINTYDNYIMLFGKEFISPLSSSGDQYYHYNAADTQYINGQRFLHLFFLPKREGENTFEGDCWIHQNTWAVKKINLRAQPTANINYVNKLSVIQEFIQKNDTSWVILKDKMVVNMSPLKNQKVSFIVRKNSIYENVKTNDPFVEQILSKNTSKEEVVINENAASMDKQYWNTLRPEPLTKNEQQVFKMIDTLKKMPLFKKYTNTLAFIVDGRKKLGQIEIGPWYKWVSRNQLEKWRFRFDVSTTEAFNKNIMLHGYLAYGVGDHKFKGKADVTYKFPNKSGYTIHASYMHDLNNGKAHGIEDDMTTDNMFSQLIRRKGVPQKFLQEKEIKFWLKKEWKNNITILTYFNNTIYETFTPLPSKTYFLANNKNISSSEIGVNIRYAPNEKNLRSKRKTFRLHNGSPVFEAAFAVGIPKIMESNYSYQRLNLSISQQCRIPAWGKINYQLYGGKIFGNSLPFMLLHMHPGNEILYYNKNSFNLMNRFEYVSDSYAGINIEHNFEKKLLNLLPFMRKSNIRQFWNVKAVVGNLSKSNKTLNLQDFPNYQMYSLNGNGYMEVGTGFENIFKFLRIDAVWRFAPTQSSLCNTKQPASNFGIFGSFRFQL